MFNKREASSKSDVISDLNEFHENSSYSQSAQDRGNRSQSTGRQEAAVIGPSIHIDGDLHGDEDLVIEGEVKGAVHLKKNSLTIGPRGKVTADVYAHTIYVDGYMVGDLYGAERISIRKSAEVRGNIASPRVSLEDGARFKGSIDMDPEAEALKKAFGENRTATRSDTSSSFSAAKSNSGKQTTVMEVPSSSGGASSGKSGGAVSKEG
jgi:cytoskeletal protein CcmA (bactofilin family)